MDDITLAKAAAQGEQEAFDELARRYRPYIYTIAYNITLNVDDSLDITQNVPLTLVRKIGGFKAQGSFRGWLATISNREAISYLRQSHRREIVTAPDELSETMDAMPRNGHTYGAGTRDNPIANLDREQRRDRVARAMIHLSPQQRSIFALLFYEELRPKEIGERLGIPDKQVSMQIHRSIEKLQRCMAEGGDVQV